MTKSTPNSMYNTDIDPRIIKFIKRHNVMTIATTQGDEAYCCNIFYAYIESQNLFVFTSGPDTRHVSEWTSNPRVAGSIVLETRVVGRVQGLQLQGLVSLPADDLAVAARSAFLKRYPYALTMDLSLWVLEPTFAKLTDNTLGFGTKLIWNRE